MPLEVLGSKLPMVTSWDLIPYGEGKEVGGRAVGETNNHGEKDPVTKGSKLVCNLPTTGVIGVWDIIKDCIRLRKKLRQSYVIKRSRAYGKDAMAIPTKGTERVKG